MERQKPLLKWVGGKTQLLDRLLPVFPATVSGNYHELFVGGGSVLLALLSESPCRISGQMYAYDNNPVLVAFYQTLQTRSKELFDCVQTMVEEFASIPSANRSAVRPTRQAAPASLLEAMESREAYFYWIRRRYNAQPPDLKTGMESVAMFYFLNKTCFRGVYRVGPNGFNVPYGHYSNPEIANRGQFETVGQLIRSVVFAHSDCEASVCNPQAGDFVYMDPPYALEHKNSFVGYTEDGFSDAKQRLLFHKCHRWMEQGVGWVMSNSDVPLIHAAFPFDGRFNSYTIHSLVARRAINAKKPEATAKELMVVYAPVALSGEALSGEALSGEALSGEAQREALTGEVSIEASIQSNNSAK